MKTINIPYQLRNTLSPKIEKKQFYTVCLRLMLIQVEEILSWYLLLKVIPISNVKCEPR